MKNNRFDLFVAPQTKQPLILRRGGLETADGQQRFPVVLHTPVLLPETDASVWHRELVELILWEHPDEIEKIYADKARWQKDPNALYRQTIRRVIGGKEEILEAIERYAAADTGIWLPKKPASNAVSFAAKRAFLKYSTARNGKRRMQTARASDFRESYAAYESQIAALRPRTLLELSTGAGTGTSLTANAMPDDARLYTVDIDFNCLGNAAGIGNYHRKTVVPVCANFWYLPFPDAVFDCVCTLNGLDESREIRRTLEEAARVLKPGGSFAVFSRKTAFMRQQRILADFGFNEEETTALLHKCRMYACAEHLIGLCAEKGLALQRQASFPAGADLTWVVSLFRKA